MRTFSALVFACTSVSILNVAADNATIQAATNGSEMESHNATSTTSTTTVTTATATTRNTTTTTITSTTETSTSTNVTTTTVTSTTATATTTNVTTTSSTTTTRTTTTMNFTTSITTTTTTSTTTTTTPVTCAGFLDCSGATPVNKGIAVECSGNSSTCDASTCCEAKATCDFFTSCSEATHMHKGSGVECSSNAGSCDQDTCCEAKATCNSYSACNETTSFNRGSTVHCSGNAASCDANTCCEVKATCGAFSSCSVTDTGLPALLPVNKGDGTKCSGNAATCDVNTCCQAAPAAEVQFAGAIKVTAIGVTKSQMETAMTKTLAKQFNVEESGVTVTATEIGISSQRRLVGALSRRLAGDWNIAFTVTAPAEQETAMASMVSTIQSDTTSLRTELATQLQAAGASSNTTGTLQVTSFVAAQASVTCAAWPSTPSHACVGGSGQKTLASTSTPASCATLCEAQFETQFCCLRHASGGCIVKIGATAVEGAGSEAAVTCSEAKATCDTFSDCTGASPTNKGNGVQCTGNAATCDVSTCCEARATCDTFSGCSGASSANKGNGVKCTGNAATCDVGTCCEAKGTCDSFSCTGATANKGNGVQCIGNAATCDVSTCCEAITTTTYSTTATFLQGANQVVLEFTLRGISWSKLDAHPEIRSAVSDSIQEGVAFVAAAADDISTRITKHHVEVTLIQWFIAGDAQATKDNTIMVHAVVTPPQEVNVLMLWSNLWRASTEVKRTVEVKVSFVEGLDLVRTGLITIEGDVAISSALSESTTTDPFNITGGPAVVSGGRPTSSLALLVVTMLAIVAVSM